MAWLADLLGRVAGDMAGTLAADWPYLLLSIVAAAAVPVYVGTDRLGAWLSRRRWVAISGAVLLATLTPFCSSRDDRDRAGHDRNPRAMGPDRGVHWSPPR